MSPSQWTLFTWFSTYASPTKRWKHWENCGESLHLLKLFLPLTPPTFILPNKKFNARVWGSKKMYKNRENRQRQNSLPSHLEVETQWSGTPGVMTPMSLTPVINLNLLQLLTAPVDETHYKRNVLLFESRLAQKCVCVPIPFKSRVVLSLVTHRQIPFHLIRCVCQHTHQYTQVSPRNSEQRPLREHESILTRLYLKSYLSVNTYTRWCVFESLQTHVMYSSPRLHWLGFTFPLPRSMACNCTKSQTCFSALVLADSSCASTISRSAVICTLSLRASSSSSILSSFLRRLSWKTMEDSVKEANWLTQREPIYQEKGYLLIKCSSIQT